MYVSVRMQGHVLGFSLLVVNAVTPVSDLSHLLGESTVHQHGLQD